MELLFDGIPLGEVSTSMTINAPASLLLLLYELVAEQQGVSGAQLRGTVQNDILKEYCARGNYIFPPKPSMRLTTDLFAYARERLPKWNTISISGYHIREAGSTAVQELAFTLANGIAYAQAAVDAGLSPDEFGERLSFFFNAHNHFFQEVAKFRAARRLWAEIMRERFGATNPKAQALRFHAQTGGSTLTAQQPENNIVRVAIQALSAVAGGAQSIHTNAFDEALALPTEHSAKIALRTQQLLAHEAGGTDTADPLGGAYFIEALTDELEAAARELIERVDEVGGAVEAIEQGFVQREIEDAAYKHTTAVESGEKVIVGVNRYQEDEAEPIELHRLDPEAERRQLERTARVRAERNADESSKALAQVRQVAEGDGNLLPPMREALQARCTVGEICERAARRLRHVRRAASVTSYVRILLVSQMYPGPDDPDLGVFVQGIERALAERGHEIELAVTEGRGGGKRRHLAPRARGATDGSAGSSRTSSTRTSSCPPGSRRPSSAARRLVVTAHGRDVRNIGAYPGIAAATRFVARRASSLIAVSDYLRRELEAKIPEARGKTEVVDCGVDLELFETRRCLAPDRSQNGPVFVCVGSLIERKNVVRLADAFARLGEGRLVFVGDGPLRGELEGRDERRGHRPRPARRSPRATSPRPTVLCQPSLIEPFGQALLEAMAAGRSVVATRVGGPPEFVPPDAGVLVDPLDTTALADAMTRAAQLPSPNPAARAAAAKHDVRLQAEKVEQILERAARDRPA